MLIVSLDCQRGILAFCSKYTVTHLWALCLRMSCSNHKNVRLCVTFCLTCTEAFHVFFAASRVQDGHCPVCTTSISSNVCCKTVLAKTSF